MMLRIEITIAGCPAYPAPLDVAGAPLGTSAANCLFRGRRGKPSPLGEDFSMSKLLIPSNNKIRITNIEKITKFEIRNTKRCGLNDPYIL